MHRRAVNTWTMATAAALLAASPVAAQEVFCRTYAQTWSTAGRCDACRLRIVPTATRSYRIEANNGWRAEVSHGSEAKGAAKGKGRWSTSTHHTYAGKSFKITLARAGNDLKMTMLVDLAAKQRIVVANFRCLDRDFTGLPLALR